MAYAFLEITAAPADDASPVEVALIQQFKEDPEDAYSLLLDRFTPAILRMIRRFMRDPDEVMEVYTSICERFRAHNFRALRRFRVDAEILPWLSVVTANACRDRLRKRRATSVPKSVISKLDAFEELVFKYYYWRRVPHEDISEIINTNEGHSCTPLDVMRAIAKINDLLSINKRWHLLVALNANRPNLSLEELQEAGVNVASTDTSDHLDEALSSRDRIADLNRAMEQLGSEDQLLILLRYEHGMKAPQIAEVMQYESHKYVYTRLRTVISRLRREIADS